jgi:hypothetical protein
MLCLAGIFSVFMQSCNDDIENRVSALEDAVAKLENAYAANKIVSAIESSAEQNGGYILSFSDGSTININHDSKGDNGANGSDGVTPMIFIDDEGFWAVSYDNGLTFTRLVDANDNPICALPSAGPPGQDGAPGICVRVVTTADGFYAFETYSPDAPTIVISTITTTLSSNPASVINSIVRNDQSGVITITMADGREFDFNLDVAYPTSIVVLTSEVSLSAGKEAKVKFRLNPSNAYFNFVTAGDNANIHLDIVERPSGRGSYVTPPTGYVISSVVKDTDADGSTLSGQYITTITPTDTPSDPQARVCLVLDTRDGKGDDIQLSSEPFSIAYGTGTEISALTIGGIEATRDGDTFSVKLPYFTNASALEAVFETDCAILSVKGEDATQASTLTLNLSNPCTLIATAADGTSKEYRVVARYSNLPVVYITTPEPIVSKDDWVKNCTMTIENAGSANIALEKVQFKGRGNSTWGFPKKPYAIKLDKKTEILGMPKHKRWCLLANWMDRTLMRNAVAFEISRRMDGLDYTPRGKFVEVVFNGEFCGNYYLCEQIRVDSNRVNITEMESTDIDDSSITGGYLLELDTNFDEVNKFHSASYNMPVNIKAPDEDVLQPAQLTYITDYINTVESSILNGSDNLTNLIDNDSFIDWWLVHELTLNGEPGHPKSSYMHKERSEVLKAGPVWDFDWGTFTIDYYAPMWIIKHAIWYGGLFNRPDFVAKVKQRWAIHKPKLETIPDFIARTADEIEESANANCIQWPIWIEVNKDETLSFRDAVSRMTDAYQTRLRWIDESISKL